MKYYHSRILSKNYEEAITAVTAALQEEGFGILTEIDVAATLKKKLNVDFKPYKILGACNPPYAYQALKAEDKIGALLPCNVVVQKVNEEETEIAVVSPSASMEMINNNAIKVIAREIEEKLMRVLDNIV